MIEHYFQVLLTDSQRRRVDHVFECPKAKFTPAEVSEYRVLLFYTSEYCVL